MELTELFGSNVFNDKVCKERLPKEIYRALKETIEKGTPLRPDVADVVANAMKDWAIEKGATHYTHWFQPLTGLTAENSRRDCPGSATASETNRGSRGVTRTASSYGYCDTSTVDDGLGGGCTSTSAAAPIGFRGAVTDRGHADVELAGKVQSKERVEHEPAEPPGGEDQPGVARKR